MSFYTEVFLFLLFWKMKIYEEKLIFIGFWFFFSFLDLVVILFYMKEGKNVYLFVWGILSGG